MSEQGIERRSFWWRLWRVFLAAWAASAAMMFISGEAPQGAAYGLTHFLLSVLIGAARAIWPAIFGAVALYLFRNKPDGGLKAAAITALVFAALGFYGANLGAGN